MLYFDYITLVYKCQSLFDIFMFCTSYLPFFVNFAQLFPELMQTAFLLYLYTSLFFPALFMFISQSFCPCRSFPSQVFPFAPLNMYF